MRLLPGLCGQHILPKGFPHDSLPSGQNEVGDLVRTSESTSTPTPPSLINTFHIATTYQGFNSDQMSQNTSAEAGPTPALHSFRVFSVRHKSKENYLQKYDSSAKNSLESKDVSDADVEQLSPCYGKMFYGELKPILMCLLCKLSFGHVRSFVAHAVRDHKVTLADEEKEMLQTRNVFAILQSFGNHPLISFLEPKRSPGICSDSLANHSDSNPNPTDVAKGMFNGMVNVIATEASSRMTHGGPQGIFNGGPHEAPAFTPDLFLNAPAKDVQLEILNNCGPQNTFTPMKNNQDDQASLFLPSNAMSKATTPCQNVLASSILESSKDAHTWSPKGSEPTKAKDLEVGEGNEMDQCLAFGIDLLQENMEMDQENLMEGKVGPSANGSLSSNEQLLSNQSIYENSVLFSQANSSSLQDVSAVDSALHEGQEGEGKDHGDTHLVEEHSVNIGISPMGNGAKSFSCPETSGNRKSNSLPSYLNNLVSDEAAHAPAQAMEISAADAFQSISFSNHMSLLHSRNSCKTLKCPKCNWHYKYQQTLQTHMKEKHPDNTSHCIYCNNGQPHPRLARGESYTCGYKPYRCEVCNYSTTTKGNLSIHMQSDKHLANLQGLQNGGPSQALGQPPSNPVVTAAVAEAVLPTPAEKPKQKASWQCKVCNYETNISRNLRIHMTSEKHMQNMMLLHQGLPLGLPSLMQPAPELYHYYGSPSISLQSMKPKQPDPRLMLNGFHLDSANLQALTSNPNCGNLSPEGKGHSGHQSKPPIAEALSSEEVSPPPEDPSTKLFSCLICRVFTCDSPEVLLYHASVGRTLPEKDWKEVAGDVHRCKLCSYGTQLKANFQLHLKTDKHSQKYQLVAHLREGGPNAELHASHLNPANPVHLRCNVCEFESNSKEKLRLHIGSAAHEGNYQIYKHMRELETLPDFEKRQFYCLLCDHSSASKLGMLRHLHSLGHQSGQSQWRMQLLQGEGPEDGANSSSDLMRFITLRESADRDTDVLPPPPSPPKNSSKDMKLDKGESVGEEEKRPPSPIENTPTKVFCCPYCSYISRNVDPIRSHVTSQHAVQPTYRCPLCQEQVMGKSNLRFHLTHIHSVVSECVERLLMVHDISYLSLAHCVPYHGALGSKKSATTALHVPIGENSSEGSNVKDAEAAACKLGKTRENSSEQQQQIKEESAEEMAITDFPSERTPDSMEKPKVPPQACDLCHQQVDTLPELKQHFDAGHPELSKTEVQQLCNQASGRSQVAANGERVPPDDCGPLVDAEAGDEKQIPAEQLEASSSLGLEMRHPLSYRKSTNFAMDKFLDPSRPYKCTICKESFTQKNILLVHYNSVSHLHKMKKASMDPSLPSKPDLLSSTDKPFKCTICRVSYNQSSTLEIHMRSVLHQTRSRVAKLEAAGTTSKGSMDQSSEKPSEKLEASGSGLKPGGTKSPPSKPETPVTMTETNENKVETVISTVPRVGYSFEQQELAKKMLENYPLQVSGIPGLSFGSPQMQLPLDLQRQASLLQTPLFAPPLLPPFPLVPEAIFQLQQHQQLLLPFYVPDFKMTPDMGVSAAAAAAMLPMPPAASAMMLGGMMQTQMEELQHQLQQKSEPQSPLSQTHPCESTAKSELLDSSIPPQDVENNKTEGTEAEMDPDKIKLEASGPSESIRKEPSSGCGGRKETSMPPPRVPVDVSRTAAKALLENFGFELVIQYNEGKTSLQKKEQCESVQACAKLRCSACGKLFSNMLILKSHEEHVHKRVLPFEELSKYAKQFRKSYDNMYPIKQMAQEVLGVATSTAPTPPLLSPSPKPPAEPSQVIAQLSQLPIPVEFSLCPPFLMQPVPLQTMPPVLAPQIPMVEPMSTVLSQSSEQSTETNEAKSSRTRITQEQLKVLWSYFDINSFPTEEQILIMSEETGLPVKVVKHWFRNKLFKERQQDKDSPYNFSNPPVLSLEEGTVTGDLQSTMLSTEVFQLERGHSRRFSRTKFSDFQFQALQSFFETSAYPKDDEVDQLSSLLQLPTRVIVVWFQNARQKARKNCEGPFNGEKAKESVLFPSDRCALSGSKNISCKKCDVAFQHIFDLIKHLKKCYMDCDNDNWQDEVQSDDPASTADDDDLGLPRVQVPESAPAPNLEAASSSQEVPQKLDDNSQHKQDSFPLDSKTEEGSPCKDSYEKKEEQSKPTDPEGIREVESQEKMYNQNQTKNQTCDETKTHKDEMQTAEKEEKEEKLILCEQTQTLSIKEEARGERISPLPTAQMEKNVNVQASVPLEQSSPKEVVPSPLVFQAVPSIKTENASTGENGFSCSECKATFLSPELLARHQSMHVLASQKQALATQLPAHLLEMPFMLFDPHNPKLTNPLLTSSMGPISVACDSSNFRNPLKRKMEEENMSPNNDNESGYLGDEPPRDKRLRTTILPEQLEILYRWYMQDSNPTRKMLDCISEEVGLKKRVVQVWFQNTRARERKGQFRYMGPMQLSKQFNKFPLLGKAESSSLKEQQSVKTTDLMGHIQNPVPSLFHEGLKKDHAFLHFKLSRQLMLAKDHSMNIHTNFQGEANKAEFQPNSVQLDDPMNDNPGNKSPAQNAAQLNTDVKAAVSNTKSGSGLGDEKSTPKKDTTPSFQENEPHSSADQMLNISPVPLKAENFKLSPVLPNTALAFSPKESGTRSPEDLSETSSIADPESPNPCGSSSFSRSAESSEHSGQRRYRTQMTSLQLKVMKACYDLYRTPTMQECEILGNEIGLQKRVIQVWFQNARAKEKKARLQGLQPLVGEQHSDSASKGECSFCNIKYDFYLSCRSHVFSRQHITKMKEVIQNQIKNEIKYYDLAPAKQVPIQPRSEEVKPSNGASLLPTQQALNNGSSFSALGFQAPNNPGLPALTPVLLSSQAIPPLGSLTQLNTGVPSPNICLAASIPPSNAVPIQSTPASSLPPKPLQQDQAPAEAQKEKPEEREAAGKRENSESFSDGVDDPSETKNATSSPGQAAFSEVTPDPMKLKALQAAIAGGSNPLLSNQFLPFSLTGAPQIFSPQLPGSLQGAYLQQLYNLKKGLLPVNPIIPQTLMGLLPNTLLQQGLQEALKKQLNSNLSLTISQATPSAAHHEARAASPSIDHQGEANAGATPETETKAEDLSHTMISTVDVTHKLICQKCKMVFEDEEAVVTHQRSFCYYGQPLKLQETTLRVPICTYHCLACDVLLSGKEALGLHLHSTLHKQRDLKQDSTFAKERANLPHTDPNPNLASTSQLLAL
nr:PREDICTED: zinc finger homeobox protein 2 [Latimeria chalumnae]|eukprot:XP_014350257.1 PREDICTED: zinc finger homeobox protein 2 [Latimeria chalumnae]